MFLYIMYIYKIHVDSENYAITSHIAGGNVKLYSPFGKQFGSSSNSQNTESLHDPAMPPRYIPKRTENTCSHKNMYMDVCCGNTHNSQ